MDIKKHGETKKNQIYEMILGCCLCDDSAIGATDRIIELFNQNSPSLEKMLEEELSIPKRENYISYHIWRDDLIENEKQRAIATKFFLAGENKNKWSDEDMLIVAKYAYEYRDTTQFPEMKFEEMAINNTKQYMEHLITLK